MNQQEIEKLVDARTAHFGDALRVLHKIATWCAHGEKKDPYLPHLKQKATEFENMRVTLSTLSGEFGTMKEGVGDIQQQIVKLQQDIKAMQEAINLMGAVLMKMPAPVEPTPAPVEPTPAPVEPTPAPVEPVVGGFADFLDTPSEPVAEPETPATAPATAPAPAPAPAPVVTPEQVVQENTPRREDSIVSIVSVGDVSDDALALLEAEIAKFGM